NVIKHGTRPNRIEATGSKRVANVFDPLRPLVRDHPNAPRYNNQSRYLAGVVSGIAAQSNAVAVAEATPKIKKPSQRSRPSNIKPVTAVLIEAAMAIRVPMNPRTRLKRPVPVVRSVITRIVSTVTAAALIPPRNCANSSIGPPAENANNSARMIPKPKPIGSKGVEIAVFAEVKDAMVTLGLLALSRIAGSGIVNFVRANPAQRNECGDAQRGSAKEYSAFRKILAGQSH